MAKIIKPLLKSNLAMVKIKNFDTDTTSYVYLEQKVNKKLKYSIFIYQFYTNKWILGFLVGNEDKKLRK